MRDSTPETTTMTKTKSQLIAETRALMARMDRVIDRKRAARNANDSDARVRRYN